LLVSRPVVYLGFGLQDPDFLMIKDELATIYDGAGRDHFAIMPNVSDLQKRYWAKEYGINILSYNTNNQFTNERTGNNHEELLILLKELQTIVKKPVLPEIERQDKTKQSFLNRYRKSLVRHCEAVIQINSPMVMNGLDIKATYQKDLNQSSSINGMFEQGELASLRSLPVQVALGFTGNMIMIGAPGTGKTFAILEHAVKLAKKALSILNSIETSDSDLHHKIPLILPMKEYTGNIKEMIRQRIPQSVDVNEALEIGCFTLILDAINETDRKLVENKVLTDNISLLIDRYPKNKFLITTRTMNYVTLWHFPVFELQPISNNVLSSYLGTFGVTFQRLSPNIIELLRNPLFLRMFVEAKGTAKSSTISKLLRKYLESVNAKLGVQINELSLLLSPIAYQLVEQGSQVICPKDFICSFDLITESEPNSIKLFNSLVSANLLVPDSDGRVGFFHQSMLEYLAAKHLVLLYKKDKKILDEKILSLRWDETIFLFIGLLPPVHKLQALEQIANHDLCYACRAFQSAAIKEKEIALILFDKIIYNLSRPNISTAEKEQLSYALLCLAPNRRKGILEKLLADPVLARNSAIFLARMGDRAIMPKILKLLLSDNCTPSLYAEALTLIADDSIIGKLLEYGKSARKNGLLSTNIGLVLQNFKSESLFKEFSRIVNEGTINQKLFLADVLKETESDTSIDLLASLLCDCNLKVKRSATFALFLIWKNKYVNHKENDGFRRIVNSMFGMLSDRDSGHWAAEFLFTLKEERIIKVAEHMLETTSNKIECFNLAIIVREYRPKIAKMIVFESLANYRLSFQDNLHYAIGFLGLKNIIPEILCYLKSDNTSLRYTVLEGLDRATWGLDSNEQLPLSTEDCKELIVIWENSVGFFEKLRLIELLSKHCSLKSKPLFLEKLRDENYRFREQLLEPLSELSLVKNDFPSGFEDWLIKNLSYTRYGAFGMQSGASKILGKISDEKIVNEKLIPLLNAEDDKVKSDVFWAILQVEKTLGKRLIDK
jgi:hypothetical protein